MFHFRRDKNKDIAQKKSIFAWAVLDEGYPIFNEIWVVNYILMNLVVFVLLSCSREDPDSQGETNELSSVREGSPSGRKITLNEGKGIGLKQILKDRKPISLEGPKIDRFDNGSKKQELNYSDGKKNGIFQRWFPNGQLEKRGNYRDDRFDGFFEAWNEEGVRKWKGFYQEGKQHGEWILFDKNGNALPTIYFKDGIETTHELPTFRK